MCNLYNLSHSWALRSLTCPNLSLQFGNQVKQAKLLQYNCSFLCIAINLWSISIQLGFIQIAKTLLKPHHIKFIYWSTFIIKLNKSVFQSNNREEEGEGKRARWLVETKWIEWVKLELNWCESFIIKDALMETRV